MDLTTTIDILNDIRRTVIKLPNSELKELIVKLIDHYINLYTERI